MAKQVLTLKFRPRTWSELVGNSLYREMLMNSVIRREVKNAYFMSGSKGSGKTTTVRILAKAIQCPNQQGGDPCNKCSTCREIDADICADVLEIDAASENRVESIRELIQQLQFAPVSCPKKVVILDEVHMLSNAAANALLKTLEEPPEHVVFMFCTTDPDKVIDTIISRCLRFDFRRLSAVDIFERLKEIAEKESIDVEKAALSLISESVNGAMRDAITVLDQAQLLTSRITEDSIAQIIGFVSFRDVFSLFEALAGEDFAKMSEWAETVSSQKSHVDIVNSILSFLQQLLVVQAGGKKGLKVPDDLLDSVKQMSTRFTLAEISSMATYARAAMSDIRRRTVDDTGIIVQLLLVAFIALKQGGMAQGQAGAPVRSMADVVANIETTPNTAIAKSSLIRRYFTGNLVLVKESGEDTSQETDLED